MRIPVRKSLGPVGFLTLLLVRIACGQSSAQQGFMTVVVNTLGGNGTFTFTLDSNPISLTTTAGTATRTFGNLLAESSHSVEETVLPDRWERTSPPLAPLS